MVTVMDKVLITQCFFLLLPIICLLMLINLASHIAYIVMYQWTNILLLSIFLYAFKCCLIVGYVVMYINLAQYILAKVN